MRRPRSPKRPMHYLVRRLNDGTVLAACPIRRPAPRIMKRDGLRVEADGITRVHSGAGKELSDWNNETRFRFQDIIATNLNTRRAIRELVLGPLIELRKEMAELRAEVDRLHGLLSAPGTIST